MFTGIVEEIGTVATIQRGQYSAVLKVHAQTVLEDTKIGDSIAVNGVCLTVTNLFTNSFTADVMHETFTRSNVSRFCTGTRVNLERAMAAGGRFGGHIMTGHIDGMGTVMGIREDENARWYEIAAPPAIMRFIVEKGSVGVDGISLTVAAVEEERFLVSVIPHTAKHTTLSEKKRGDLVNLENDCIGKYVEKLLKTTGESKVTKHFLAENGFL